MIKVLLADSNALIREGLKTVLQADKDFKVTDEAETGNDLYKMLKKTDADVVMVDYTSPGFSIDIIYKCKAEYPDTKLVAITYDQMGSTIVSALKSGIMSYIKKDCDLDEIRDAVRDTAEGNQFFCGKILETIQLEHIDVDDIEYEPISCAPISLSQRELEIIQLIADGHTNAVVAEKLFLSAHTITTHRKNIMAKLGVNNTAAIVMYAVKNNLVSPNKYLFSS